MQLIDVHLAATAANAASQLPLKGFLMMIPNWRLGCNKILEPFYGLTCFQEFLLSQTPDAITKEWVEIMSQMRKLGLAKLFSVTE